jgi:tetratricopeptide (TPR) repeat protein
MQNTGKSTCRTRTRPAPRQLGSSLVTDRLRALWDFDDLDASEARFRAQLARQSSSSGQAEVLTQLARVEGLRGAFDEGDGLLEEAEALGSDDLVAHARIDLERGRLRRSSGDPAAARPHFEKAFETALEAGELFIAVDAAHMAALAAPDDDAFAAWTEQGIEIAERGEPSVRYWLGPMLNNLGWHQFERGHYEKALAAFERALEEREREPENRQALELALYGVGKTLRALSRADEAVPLLERATASAAMEDRADGWLHEELAETYAALGRKREARAHAERALALLPAADPEFHSDGERDARLRRLAAELAKAP